MGVGAYLAVSAALFALGIVAIVVRRNVLYVLMGIEMILNAANINFVAFARHNGGSLEGQMFAIFVIILAAAEAAVALAIFLNFYNNFSTIDVERAQNLKG
jgi:NADH-quinone oxidoreductase subunit K